MQKYMPWIVAVIAIALAWVVWNQWQAKKAAESASGNSLPPLATTVDDLNQGAQNSFY